MSEERNMSGEVRAARAAEDGKATVTDACVSVANSLVDGFDLVDLYVTLTTDCVRLLDVDAAGMLLAAPPRVLHVGAASSEQTRKLELFQLQSEEGPCVDCFRSGTPVIAADLGLEAERWPRFV